MEQNQIYPSAFLATAVPGARLNSMDIMLIFTGKHRPNPFNSQPEPSTGRYMAKSAFPIILPDNTYTRKPEVIVDMSAVGGNPDIISWIVDDLETSRIDGRRYYSLNLEASADYIMQVQEGVPFRVCTVFFPVGLKMAGIGLVNQPHQLLAQQGQVTLEDNLANEYFNPFDSSQIFQEMSGINKVEFTPSPFGFIESLTLL